MQETAALRRNPAIEAILANSQLAIEAGFGMQCLNQYLSDLALLSSGAPYSSLGIEQRRRESDPHLIVRTGAAAVTINDRYILNNSALTPPGAIAVLKLSGFMQTEGSGGSGAVRGMRGFAEDLRAAYSNQNIAGILLEINSGGGEVLAMEVAVSAIQERNKPIVAHAYFAASAAYGTAAATDEIVALSDMVRLGSIGSVISLNKAALAEYAEQYIDLYGSNAPRKNKEFRAAIEGDYTALQQVVDEATDKFQAKVKSMRPLRGSENKISDTLSGDVFAADEARRRGLVDGIGSTEYALKRLEAWIKRGRA